MSLSKAKLVRIALVLAAAALVPACYDNSETIVISGAGTAVFADAFDGEYPGTGWTAPAGDGTAAIDSGALMLSGAKNGDTVTTETVLAFANPPLTMSLHMAASVADRGVLTVSIVDSTNAVVASMVWDLQDATVTYDIQGTSAVDAAPSADGTFHALAFSVNGSGDATWSLNAANELTMAGFPAGNLKLRISASWGPGGAEDFLIDNVLVTTP